LYETFYSVKTVGLERLQPFFNFDSLFFSFFLSFSTSPFLCPRAEVYLGEEIKNKTVQSGAEEKHFWFQLVKYVSHAGENKMIKIC
jgi:hypothetical protein